LSLTLLITLIADLGEVEAQLTDMGETDIPRIEKGGQAVVVVATELEGDITVEEANGDFVEVFGDEAGALEIGGAGDLAELSVMPLW
jgi:hypothetical protein